MGKEKKQNDEKSSPFILGITGHRFMEISAEIVQAVVAVLAEVVEANPARNIELYCPLAEGADQLVAQESVKFPQIKLTVVLPMPIEDYRETFFSTAGKDILMSFIGKAENTILLPKTSDHETAYHQLGQHLIKNVDWMIALWNGEKGSSPGGTGEVVIAAQEAGIKIYWIYAENYREGVTNPTYDKKLPGDIEILNP